MKYRELRKIDNTDYNAMGETDLSNVYSWGATGSPLTAVIPTDYYSRSKIKRLMNGLGICKRKNYEAALKNAKERVAADLAVRANVDDNIRYTKFILNCPEYTAFMKEAFDVCADPFESEMLVSDYIKDSVAVEDIPQDYEDKIYETTDAIRNDLFGAILYRLFMDYRAKYKDTEEIFNIAMLMKRFYEPENNEYANKDDITKPLSDKELQATPISSALDSFVRSKNSESSKEAKLTNLAILELDYLIKQLGLESQLALPEYSKNTEEEELAKREVNKADFPCDSVTDGLSNCEDMATAVKFMLGMSFMYGCNIMMYAMLPSENRSNKEERIKLIRLLTPHVEVGTDIPNNDYDLTNEEAFVVEYLKYINDINVNIQMDFKNDSIIRLVNAFLCGFYAYKDLTKVPHLKSTLENLSRERLAHLENSLHPYYSLYANNENLFGFSSDNNNKQFLL